jgi:riboflavin kinase/FMN adenylyltransferase
MDRLRYFEDRLPGHSVATVGTFDGVHLAHQALLRTMNVLARAESLSRVVLYFPVPPRYRARPEGQLLTLPEERERLLEAAGVDVVVPLPLPEILQVTPEQFLDDLRERFGVRHLVMGFNHRFGRARSADPAWICAHIEAHPLTLHVLPPFRVGSHVVSSETVRSLLRDGDVETAARLLGRPYRLRGTVGPGDGRGRSLGFPTANLALPPLRLRPRAGVYGVRVHLEGEVYAGVAHLGARPTFAAPEPVLEVHLLDFSGGELYGRTLDVEMLFRLRDVQRFPDTEALRRAIQADIAAARARFQEEPLPGSRNPSGSDITAP